VDDRFTLDTATVRRAFNKARNTFDAAAIVQREVRYRALERLRILKSSPDVILDLGAGTGHGSAWLKKQYPRAQVIAIDSALGMLHLGGAQQGYWRKLLGRSFSRVGGDAAAIPLRATSVDWVFSNLMLPWCASLEAALSEVHRVIRPGGVFSFTSFGPDTLRELRQAWQSDTHDHVHPFVDMHDLGDALVRTGFAEPVLDVERFTLTYPDVKALLKDLQEAGSANALPTRRQGLTGPGRLQEMVNSYESLRYQGKLPATYEVVYGQAWRGQAKPITDESGETKIPVSAIRRRSR
jgi:malonyl-CoA O-methyltransferase